MYNFYFEKLHARMFTNKPVMLTKLDVLVRVTVLSYTNFFGRHGFLGFNERPHK